MPAPSLDELNRMRAAVEADTQTDLADVLRQDLVKDRGIETPRDPNNPWPVVDTNVRVNVYPVNLTPRNSMAGQAVTVEGGFNAQFAVGYDIRNKDRIRVTTLNNRVFRMIGPRYASTEIARIMACEEVT